MTEEEVRVEKSHEKEEKEEKEKEKEKEQEQEQERKRLEKESNHDDEYERVLEGGGYDCRSQNYSLRRTLLKRLRRE